MAECYAGDELSARGAAAAATAPDITLPSNVDAERSLLGAILLDDTLYSEAGGALKPDDFFLDAHRRIYARMLEMADTNRPIDIVTLSEELKKHGELKAIGGAAYLSSLTDGTPRRSSIAHYLRIIREKSALRDLAREGEQLQLAACEPGADPRLIVDRMAALAEQARAGLCIDDNWRGLFHSVEEFEQAPALQFAIEGFSQEGGIGLIPGLVAQGKTLIMLAMVQSMLEQTRYSDEIVQGATAGRRVCTSSRNQPLDRSGRGIKLFQLEDHVRADRSASENTFQ